MGKVIAICCDGTWNRRDQQNDTNVVKLHDHILKGPTRDGPWQEPRYVAGVGSTVRSQMDHWLGGLFGVGLDDQILEAYGHLVTLYRPGDRIFVFGFSRGAYCARSLTGLIRNCGILEVEHAGRAREAMALYRSGREADAPDGENALTFRACYAAGTLTSSWEAAWRRNHGFAVPDPEPDRLGVHYLGVWDTVGSLGIPAGLDVARLVNRRYQFHDTKLSTSVGSARHAVAIDEHRRSFLPTLWANICALEAERPGAYREQWFPGEHGSVGGGGEVTDLSDAGLRWIAEGAREAGLRLDEAWFGGLAAAADPCGLLTCMRAPGRSVARWFLGFHPVDRSGVTHAAHVSETALTRWRDADPRYRPATLTPLTADLDRMTWAAPGPAGG
ncbi:MAG: DUF2235 domain-containing protein [Amaricoccus sp.]